ncbi:hypothetical protein Bca101_087763 [Brassica carinata]
MSCCRFKIRSFSEDSGHTSTSFLGSKRCEERKKLIRIDVILIYEKAVLLIFPRLSSHYRFKRIILQKQTLFFIFLNL